MFMRRNPGDYDHLARVKEWSLTGGDAEDEGEAGNERAWNAHAAQAMCALPRTGLAPGSAYAAQRAGPLAGRGREAGWAVSREYCLREPPPPTPPRKGEGSARPPHYWNGLSLLKGARE